MARRKKQGGPGARVAILILLILAIGIGGIYSILSAPPKVDGVSIPKDDVSQSSSQETPMTFPVLYSSKALLVRLGDKKELLSVGKDEEIAPASLTKIMTAVVVLERMPDLSKKITVDKAMYQKLEEENASTAGFEPGETVTAMDLLYGAILPSGAEASIALAEDVAGSEAEFAKLMNETAAKIGMTKTHFVNCTGLDESGHKSTVGDLALLLAYALDNQQFRTIFTATDYVSTATNQHPKGLTMRSILSSQMEKHGLSSQLILGSKTGFTDLAGLCLASLGNVNGQEYILITAGAMTEKATDPFNLLDAVAIYNALQEQTAQSSSNSSSVSSSQA